MTLTSCGMDVDRSDFAPHRGPGERGVGDQRDLLALAGVAQATAQRFTVAGGGERAHRVAVTVGATGAHLVEVSGVDGVDQKTGKRGHVCDARAFRGTLLAGNGHLCARRSRATMSSADLDGPGLRGLFNPT